MRLRQLMTAALGSACLVLGLAACGEQTNRNADPAPGPHSSTAGPSPSHSSPSHSSPATHVPPPPPPPQEGPAAYFTPKKLAPGQKPPQFIVLSFDGAGWHEKWQYWHSIADRVPLRFTGFLTGLYLLDEQHKDAYQGPGHAAGHSSLGSWNTAAEVAQEVRDLNDAYRRGDEIGTHFMGHFCSDNPPGANDWSTADWNSELDQFFRVYRTYRQIDGLDMPKLNVPVSSIKGERTPCLEGHTDQLFPALRKHDFRYDSSPDRAGIAWPTKSAEGIYQMGMADFPLAGTDHKVITMDYNFWYTQEGASSDVSPQKSQQDADQVTQTYMNMYDATFNGNRAPIILGNHFESWNNNAYTKALAKFALNVCGRPDTHCVPFIDVVRWMDKQDPAVLQHLQSLPPETGLPAA